MGKRVGIITFHFVDNYGAILQAAALQKWFQANGHEVEIIDYCPSHVEKGGNFYFSCNKQQLRANLKIAYLKVCFVRERLFGSRNRRSRFASFRRQHLVVSCNHYRTLEELKIAPPAAWDLLVCGSDQIWSPSEQFGLDAAYFLDFGSIASRRISYAASFGKPSLAEKYRAQAGRLIDKLDGVSVRETSGVELVWELTSRKAACVPDPTLLWQDYEEMVVQPTITVSPYIFNYSLRSGNEINRVVRYASSRLGLPVYTPYNPMSRWKADGEVVDPGPAEWLGYIQQAQLVITNSFHGTIFSIIFHKPFITVSMGGARSVHNERATSLLGQLGLLERLLSSEEPELIERLLNSPIDWGIVNQKLAKWRCLAEEFLMQQIANIDANGL